MATARKTLNRCHGQHRADGPFGAMPSFEELGRLLQTSAGYRHYEGQPRRSG